MSKRLKRSSSLDAHCRRPRYVNARSHVDEVVAHVNEGLSLHAAAILVAKESGAAAHSLEGAFRRLQNVDVEARKCHGRQTLTDNQETGVVDMMVAFSLANSPLSVNEVISTVRELFHLGPAWDGRSWWGRFVDRHKNDLKLHKFMGIVPSRISRNLPSVVDNWRKIVGTRGASVWLPHTLINADESLVRSERGHVVFTRFGPKGIATSNAVEVRYEREVGSVIPFISADGHILFAVWVLVGHKVRGDGDTIEVNSFEQLREVTGLRSQVKHFYTVSTTGFVTLDLWAEIISLFTTFWISRNPGLECHLLLDQLAVHRNRDIVTRARLHMIRTWFFPPNATHILQPLDNLAFAAFHGDLERRVNEANSQYLFVDNTDDEFSLLKEAIKSLESTMTKDVITGSFKRTGIWPWKAEVILENTKTKCGDTGMAKLTTGQKLALETIKSRMRDRTAPRRKRKWVGKMNKIFDDDDIRQLQNERERTKKTQMAAKIASAASKLKQQKARRLASKKASQLRVEGRALFLGEKNRRKAEKERESKRRLEEKATARLKASQQCFHCKKSPRGKWIGCGSCDVRWVCEKCLEKPGLGARSKLARHEIHCEKSK